jgi:hypothetical protein
MVNGRTQNYRYVLDKAERAGGTRLRYKKSCFYVHNQLTCESTAFCCLLSSPRKSQESVSDGEAGRCLEPEGNEVNPGGGEGPALQAGNKIS